MHSEELQDAEVNPSAPRMLSLDDILGCDDLEERIVEVPQWGGAVKIHSFTKAEQHQMRKDASDPRTGELDPYRLEELMFVRGLVDPRLEDRQVFNIRKKSSVAFDTVLRAIVKLSGGDPEAAKSSG